MPSLTTRRGVGLVAAAALAWTPVALAASQASAQPAPVRTQTSTAATSPHAVSAKLPTGLRFYQQRTSILGVHRWYQQRHNHRIVVGGWYAVHHWNDGTTTVYDGRRPVRKLATTTTKVTPERAAGLVDHRDKRASTPKTSHGLMILPGRNGAPARLVWQVLTTDGQGVTASYVDASTGKTLRTEQLAKSFTADTRTSARTATTSVTGHGQVFDPNPVVSQQDETLKDHNDSNTAVPDAAYALVDLPRLDTSHTLTGRWARIINANVAGSPTDTYLFKRADNRFEQVNAYYAVDAEQNYLRRLGLTHVNAESQKLKTDAFPDDNSFYNPSNDQIWFGTGGVDDAEDPEVVWHEYGHAIQDDQVPDFGRSVQAGSIGEGFGDYMAAVLSQAVTTPNDTAVTPASCLMDWDSTSYTTTTPHCIRTTNAGKNFLRDRDGEVHDDGEIWSQALWQMYKQLLDPATSEDVATKIIVEAQFAFTPGISMPAAAKRVVKTAKALYPSDPSIAATTRIAFEKRHIL